MDHAKQKKIDGDVKGDKMAKNTDSEGYVLTDEDEIFLRRSSIARTPPGRYRVNSLPEAWKMRAGKSKRKESSDEETTEEDRETEQANKRKKEEVKSNAELDRALAEVKALIKKMGATARKLKTLVVENVNTKVEIKKTVAEADTQAEALDKNFQKWEVLSKAHKEEEMMKTTEKKEFGTQTEAVETVRKERKQLQEETKAKIIEAVRKGGTYEDYLRIGNLKWDNDVFKTAEETREDIMGLPRGWDLAVLTALDLNHETGAARMFVARFQSEEFLKDQVAAVGDVAYLTATVAVEGKDGCTREWERLIMYGMAAEKTGDIWNDRDTFKCVTSIRQMAEGKKRHRIAIAGSDMCHDTALKKMIEFVFSGSEIDVRLVIDPTKARGVSEKSTAPTQRSRAIVVRAGGGDTFAEVLRTVKDKVDVKKTGVEVESIRKTKTGDLLVSLKKSQSKQQAEVLAEAIRKEVGQAKVDTLGDREVVLHVMGMDGITGNEELKEALGQIAGEQVRIISIWEAFGGKRNAAVKASKRAAGVLLDRGVVRIGWVQCRIRARSEVVRCYRCWETGHIAAACQGEDRTDRCYRCNGTGHKARECSRSPFCTLCKKVGHRANAVGCQARGKNLGGGGRPPTPTE